MLFDLRGKRKRAVQATYLGLAVLIGVGLVGFGIGGQGGGIFSNNNGNGGGKNKANKLTQARILAALRTLTRDPKNEAALAILIHNHYSLAAASGNPDPSATSFGPKAVPELQRTDAAWQRYFNVAKKPSVDVAKTAFQADSQLITLVPAKKATYAAGGANALTVIAAAQPSSSTYVGLAQFASLAGQTRTAQLAAKNAIRLAPKDQQAAIKQQVAPYLQPATPPPSNTPKRGKKH
jgi:phage gpG-like protein